MPLLTLSLSSEAQAKLKVRAKAEGKKPTAYATDLLEQAVSRPSLTELIQPSQAEFAKTGMTRKQVMELGSRVVARVRSRKGKRK